MHKAPLTQTFAFIVSLVPLNMIWANDNAVSPEQRSTPTVQVTAGKFIRVLPGWQLGTQLGDCGQMLERERQGRQSHPRPKRGR